MTNWTSFYFASYWLHIDLCETTVIK